jgi:hypothetical protein
MIKSGPILGPSETLTYVGPRIGPRCHIMRWQLDLDTSYISRSRTFRVPVPLLRATIHAHGFECEALLGPRIALRFLTFEEKVGGTGPPGSSPGEVTRRSTLSAPGSSSEAATRWKYSCRRVGLPARLPGE